MTGNRLLASFVILLAVAVNSAYAEYNVSEYCELVKPGTQFPSFTSCQKYYTCQATGYDTNYCPATESFDKDAQSCKPSSTVNCYIGISDPCAATTATFVPDPKDCRGYIYCKNNVNSGSGTCPPPQIFDGTTGGCRYGTCNNDQNGVVEITNLCQIMPSGTFFGDFEDCNIWHKCTAGTMNNGTCKAGLVYSTLRNMCLTDDGTMCSRVENPSLPPAEPCTTALDDKFKGDARVCSVYYECDGNTWNKKTCNTGEYYDRISHDCVDRQAARATKGCNRCQYSTSTWVNAVDPACLEYLVCNDGKELAQGSCDKKAYFDEQRQGCLPDRDTLTTYSNSNGACYNPNDVESSTTESDGNNTSETPEGNQSTETPAGDQSTETPAGDQSTETPAGDQSTETPAGDQSTETPAGDQSTETPAGDQSTETPAGDQSTETPKPDA